TWLIPKPEKVTGAAGTEPAFTSRVPGAGIYARPGERLRIHVKNADLMPHSFHVHGLAYGIDSDGSWPFGTQSQDGRRSDEICPGQVWTYTFDIDEGMLGAWPFHDHHRDIGMSVNRGLFGGIIVLPHEECEALPVFPLPKRLLELLKMPRDHGHGGHEGHATPTAGPHGGMVMPMGPGATMPMGHMADVLGLPPELRDLIVNLDELAHAPQHHLIPKPPHPLPGPGFPHQMSGGRGSAVF